jgi:hypothetical protein
MRYSVVWHDCEDDRTGSEFMVEANSPTDAYFMAGDEIRSYSDYLTQHFCGIDIEALIDESGKFLYPDYFLEEDKQKATGNINNILEKPAGTNTLEEKFSCGNIVWAALASGDFGFTAPKANQFDLLDYPTGGIKNPLHDYSVTREWSSDVDGEPGGGGGDWTETEYLDTKYIFLEKDRAGSLKKISKKIGGSCLSSDEKSVDDAKRCLEANGHTIDYIVEHQRLDGPNWGGSSYKIYLCGD